MKWRFTVVSRLLPKQRWAAVAAQLFHETSFSRAILAARTLTPKSVFVVCLLCMSLFWQSQSRANSPRAVLPTFGLWAQFEERGSSSGYWPGQVIQNFSQYDPIVGATVSTEVALQLGKMKAMGVNTITIELRSADKDGNFTYPVCDIDPSLGFQWPQPTATELTNIKPFFDLVQSQGFKIILVLVNTHMEEGGSVNAQTWLGSILNAIKNHPALDFVVFNGTPRLIDTNNDGVTDACGIPAEAPLWLGPTAVPASYVKWAMTYAMSLGVPITKLGAGTVVGDFFTDSQPSAGSDATDGHLWPPIMVMKDIFDALGIANSQRTYALSFYEHRKCNDARYLSCTDEDPATWADETLGGVYNTIGSNSGARVVAYEMGNMTPINSSWSTENALGNLLAVLEKYGADGGSFWRWVNFTTSEDADSTVAKPIKIRGTAFNYTAVENVLANFVLGTSSLEITPTTPLNFHGPVGGPFATDMPGRITLTNTGPAALSYSISPPNWLAVSPSSTGLVPGGNSVSVMILPNPYALNVGAGNYSSSIMINNATNGSGNTSIVTNLLVNQPPGGRLDANFNGPPPVEGASPIP